MNHLCHSIIHQGGTFLILHCSNLLSYFNPLRTSDGLYGPLILFEILFCTHKNYGRIRTVLLHLGVPDFSHVVVAGVRVTNKREADQDHVSVRILKVPKTFIGFLSCNVTDSEHNTLAIELVVLVVVLKYCGQAVARRLPIAENVCRSREFSF